MTSATSTEGPERPATATEVGGPTVPDTARTLAAVATLGWGLFSGENPVVNQATADIGR